MARHCVREPRYIPPVHVIGEQPDLFGGPTISHATERKPISNKWMSDMTKWAVSPWLGDMDPESALEPETVLETAPAPLPVYLVACVAARWRSTPLAISGSIHSVIIAVMMPSRPNTVLYQGMPA